MQTSIFGVLLRAPIVLLLLVIFLVVVRVCLLFALRKRYPELNINELVDVCIKLTSFTAKRR